MSNTTLKEGTCKLTFIQKFMLFLFLKLNQLEVVKPHSSAQYGICMKDQGIDLHWHIWRFLEIWESCHTL